MAIAFLFLMMNVVLDIGNTRVKYAFYKDIDIFKRGDIPLEKYQKNTLDLLQKYTADHLLIASVVPLEKSFTNGIATLVKKILIFDHKTPLQFENLYHTPDTLGVDRLALIAAATAKFPHTAVLVIDMGTCITYDFKNAQNQYLGGAITPGITMRYKSMATHTKSLPNLSPIVLEDDQIIGRATNDCIHKGVLRGVLFEIEGFVNAYQKQFPETKIVLTGGDAFYLSNHLKKTIFARPNFLLDGLLEILLYNTSYV